MNKPKNFFSDVEKVSFATDSRFNPHFYFKILNHFNNGRKLYSYSYTYNQDFSKEKLKEKKEFITLDQFEEFIWDNFDNISSKYAHWFLFGPFGMKGNNPHRTKQVYYDGYIFAITSQEYKEIALDQKNITFSKLLSFLVHFGFDECYFSEESI